MSLGVVGGSVEIALIPKQYAILCFSDFIVFLAIPFLDLLLRIISKLFLHVTSSWTLLHVYADEVKTVYTN